MYCRNCGKELDENQTYCTSCGFDARVGKNYCYSCGKKVGYEDVNKCPICGFVFIEEEKKDVNSFRKPKSLLAAAFLQVLCPFLSLGNFYLGFNKKAFIQVLVTILTFGLGVIWPFVDGLIIFTGKIKNDAYGIELTD